MITINYYTGKWQAACSRGRVNPRAHVLIHDNPDAREYDDFVRTLRDQGLELGDFVRFFPRKRMNQYCLQRND